MLLTKLSSPQPAVVDGQSVKVPLALPVTSSSSADADLIPIWKRLVDLTACALALPLLAVCTLIMGIVIKLTSPGPVFFRQERVGYLGRRFRIYKFRTMRVDAETSVHQNYTRTLIETNAPMTKLDARGDARLIPGAWFLRASGLDELPQFINVILGDMSLVGPRPCIPSEFECFEPRHRQRCEALPGLTGLWQVSGKNRTTYEQMLDLDVRYTQKLSPWMDVKIIVMTLPALIIQIQDTRRARKSPSKSMRAPTPIGV